MRIFDINPRTKSENTAKKFARDWRRKQSILFNNSCVAPRWWLVAGFSGFYKFRAGHFLLACTCCRTRILAITNPITASRTNRVWTRLLYIFRFLSRFPFYRSFLLTLVLPPLSCSLIFVILDRTWSCDRNLFLYEKAKARSNIYYVHWLSCKHCLWR